MLKEICSEINNLEEAVGGSLKYGMELIKETLSRINSNKNLMR